jgi:hypothetical protein
MARLLVVDEEIISRHARPLPGFPRGLTESAARIRLGSFTVFFPRKAIEE